MAEPAEVTAACAPAVESPPDADAVELCGRFVSGLLQRFRATGDRDCRCPATAVTFADKLMARSFDRLYDMMSHDLLRAADGDVRARPPPQLRLYDDLGEFTRLCSPLHEINRFVFGNGQPSDGWERDVACALYAVREWRTRIEDETTVSKGLVETYKSAAERRESQADGARDIAMVALAVFGFMLGYDTTVDHELLRVLEDADTVYGPVAFRQVYNAVSRHARTFLEASGSAEHECIFESLVGRPDVAAASEWIHDLMVGSPGAFAAITTSPFSRDPDVLADEIGNVVGRKLSPSYVVQLGTFYGWMANELCAFLSGGFREQVSISDQRIRQCLCTLSDVSWTQLFEDAHLCALRHLDDVLGAYSCPSPILEVFRATWTEAKFKTLLKFFANERVDCTLLYAVYDNVSTDSTDSDYSLSEDSC